MDYTIIRSKRKTLALEITRDAGLVVRAPARCPLKDIGLFVENHRDWIELHREKRLKHMEKYPEPTAAELEALREQAKSLIPQRVAHYAGVMGLTPAAVKINTAKTRFGSCSQRDSLNFSCRLMLYPQAAID
jgi:predicted metal-dependent hydrolase